MSVHKKKSAQSVQPATDSIYIYTNVLFYYKDSLKCPALPVEKKILKEKSFF